MINIADQELIKTWRKDGFTLRLWDTGTTSQHNGATRLRYELKDHRTVVMKGDDFYASPMHGDNSLHTVCGLLGFLTLKPGDTDHEYFDKYTAPMMKWCESSRCEELGMIGIDMEDWLAKKERSSR